MAGSDLDRAALQKRALSRMLDGDFEGAIAAIDAALAIRKDAIGYFIKGRALDEMLDVAGSIACYRKCLDRDKAHAKARLYLALAHLSRGDFAEGTRYYRHRLTPEEQARAAATRRWTGKARGGRVLIWAEQGIGDEVMFLQLLHLARVRDCAFTVACDRRLIPILAANFPEITFIERGGAIDWRGYDAQIPIGDLFALFWKALLAGEVRRPSLVPVPRPEVAQAAAAVRGDRRLVGLSWFSVSEDYGARRSVPVAVLARALDPAQHAIAILQYAAPEEDIATLRALGFACVAGIDTLNDIEGVFALIGACDAVLGIDNSVAHFAGAIGVETHVLLPQLPNWRWGIGGETSYWYPSLRLHRRAAEASWADVVAAITLG